MSSRRHESRKRLVSGRVTGRDRPSAQDLDDAGEGEADFADCASPFALQIQTLTQTARLDAASLPDSQFVTLVSRRQQRRCLLCLASLEEREAARRKSQGEREQLGDHLPLVIH